MTNKKLIVLFGLAASITSRAQTDTLPANNKLLDSIYIEQIEEQKYPPKVLHAEPLYIDLIRDLGARKGEKEWNFGLGMTDNLSFDTYTMMAEYEFAPVNRLGMEIELPFTFSAAQKNISKDSIPGSKIESIKTAVQWTFLVSEKLNTSLALGYIHELEMNDFNKLRQSIFTGNVFNPFFVAAKRWGNNFHTLLYTGPRIEKSWHSSHIHSRYDINTNFHYMISGTRNFVGIEFNKNVTGKDFDMVIRPQMRVSIADNFLVGIVSGIPVNRENQRFSMFTRLIWEPGHRR